MLKVFWLLLLVSHPSYFVAGYCDSTRNSDDEIFFKVFKFFTQTIMSFAPGDPVNPLLNLVTDLRERDQDYRSITSCYIKNYHREQVFTETELHDKRIVRNPKNARYLKSAIIDMEHANSLGKLIQSQDYLKAAVYPVLVYRATTHIRAYKLMIQTEILYGKWSQNAVNYAKKHDDWVIFYTQLILRYWRPYRKELLKLTNDMYRNPSIIENPAENLVKHWSNLAYYSNTGEIIKNLIKSCVVKSGKRVMFNVLLNRRYKEFPWGRMDVGKEWLSCFVSGTTCHANQCPHIYTGQSPSQSPFQLGNHFDFGIHCRGEVFWIYADYSKITDGIQMNLKYSIMSGKGYYISLRRGQYYAKDELTTKICPTKHWSHIRSYCGDENFKVDKAKLYSSSNVVYDGNLLCLDRGIKVDRRSNPGWDWANPGLGYQQSRRTRRDDCAFETDINLQDAETLKTHKVITPHIIIV